MNILKERNAIDREPVEFEEIKPANEIRAKARIETIKGATLPDPDLLRYRVELGPNPTPQQRYDMEYQKGIYESYKPGIDDDGIENFLGVRLGSFGGVVEIGGGPAYICENFMSKNPRGIALCPDIARSPRLDKIGAIFVKNDIAQRKSSEKISSRMVSCKSLIVLSYCLDRVSDQREAIRNFADLIKQSRDNVGLITVCLPAKSVSPGVGLLDYSESGKWLTKGESGEEDFTLIAEACEKNELKILKSGITKHYGVCLDGYEELLCYCMVLKADLPR